MQFQGCHFQCDCLLFVSSANHNRYLAFIIDKFLVLFSIPSFHIYSMNFAETMSCVAMMHFTRNSNEQEMIWVYHTFRTILKIFPSVISRDGCEGKC
jgi:hypothetical protein